MKISTTQKVTAALNGTGMWPGGFVHMYNDKRKTFRRLKVSLTPILNHFFPQSLTIGSEPKTYRGKTKEQFYAAFDAELKKQFGDDLIKNMPYEAGYMEYVIFLKV